jgi:hypothetical protein
LIVNFNLTASAFANESGALSETLRLLPGTLAIARDALNSVDRALPPTRAFAKEILPGVRQTAATVDAAFPWIEQTRALLGPDELQGLMAELTPATRDLARLTDQSLELLPEIDDFAQCFDKVILPAGNVRLDDGALTTRRSDGSVVEAYKEFWYGLAGLTASGQSFDGNGALLRTLADSGEFQVQPATSTYTAGSTRNKTLVGTASQRPLGTRPLYPRSPVMIRTTNPCKRAGVPDLNGPQAGPGAAPRSVVVPTPPEERREPTTPVAPTSLTAVPATDDAAADDAAATASLGAQLLSRLNPLANGETR